MKDASKSIISFVSILALSVILLFYSLGSTALTNWDEAWYAAISRTMYRSSDYLSLYWNGGYLFEKPPLYMWFTTLAFTVFGETEFAVRFFSALSGVGIVVCVFFMAKRYWGIFAGAVSSLVLLSIPSYLYRARTGNLDATMTFFLVFALYSYVRGIKEKSNWLFFIGCCTALAFMTKGTPALFLCLFIVLFGYLKKEYNVLSSVEFISGLFVGVVGVIFWIVLSYHRYGSPFLSGFFAHQTEKFLTNGVFWQHFSLVTLSHIKSGMKLWILFLFPAFLYWFVAYIKDERFIVPLFFSMYLLFLLFTENKSNWFLFPLYPLAAIMIGAFIHKIRVYVMKTVSVLPVLIGVSTIVVFHLVWYSHEYVVPDISKDEKYVAMQAKLFVPEKTPVYVTDYLLPTTVYYSEHQTFAVYSDHEENRAWFILPKADWNDILKRHDVYIISRISEFESLREYFAPHSYEILFQSGDRQLIHRL